MRLQAVEDWQRARALHRAASVAYAQMRDADLSAARRDESIQRYSQAVDDLVQALDTLAEIGLLAEITTYLGVKYGGDV